MQNRVWKFPQDASWYTLVCSEIRVTWQTTWCSSRSYDHSTVIWEVNKATVWKIYDLTCGNLSSLYRIIQGGIFPYFPWSHKLDPLASLTVLIHALSYQIITFCTWFRVFQEYYFCDFSGFVMTEKESQCTVCTLNWRRKKNSISWVRRPKSRDVVSAVTRVVLLNVSTNRGLTILVAV